MSEDITVFISFATKDNENSNDLNKIVRLSDKIVARINEKLAENHRVSATVVKKFMAGETGDALVGNLMPAIEKEIASADIFIAMESKLYLERPWCMKEAFSVNDDKSFFRLQLEDTNTVGDANTRLDNILPGVTCYKLYGNDEDLIIESISDSISAYLVKYILENTFTFEVTAGEDKPVVFFAHPAEDRNILSYAKRVENLLIGYADADKIELMRPSKELYEHLKDKGKTRIKLPDNKIDLFIQLLSPEYEHAYIEEPQYELSDLCDEKNLVVWMPSGNAGSSLRDNVTIKDKNDPRSLVNHIKRRLEDIFNRKIVKSEVFIDLIEQDKHSCKEAEKLMPLLYKLFKKSCYCCESSSTGWDKYQAALCKTVFVLYGDEKYKNAVDKKWRQAVAGYDKGRLLQVMPEKKGSAKLGQLVTPDFYPVDAQTDEGVLRAEVVEEIRKVLDQKKQKQTES